MKHEKLRLFAILLLGLGQTGLQAQTVKDIENNIYKTVKIGNQIWMSENLKTTKFNDGKAIQLVTVDTLWSADVVTPAYCWYGNDTVIYKNGYGALYNWHTVGTDKLCPTGWHIPSESEWTALIDFLDGSSLAGGSLMQAGTKNWSSPNYVGTNKSGFTALPGGTCIGGGCFGMGDFGNWWSSTEINASEAWFMELAKNNGYAAYGRFVQKHNFYSIRCIKDRQYAKLPQGEFETVSNGNKNGIYSIDQKKMVVPIAFDYIVIPNESKYPYVNVRNVDKNGIYDMSSNKLVVPCLFSEEIIPHFYSTSNNNKKLEFFIVENTNTHTRGLLDATGKVLLESIYTEILPLQETENYSAGYFKYVNNKGELLDGLNEKLLWGYFVLDFNSNTFKKSPLKFGYVAMGQTPNTALVLDFKTNAMGLINCQTDKYIVESNLKFAKPISGTNFFKAEKNDQKGVFDFSGKEIVPFGLYDIINENYYQDTILFFNVSKNNKWGCIDSKGIVVIPVIFDTEVMFKNIICASKDGKWGCVDKTMKQIVDFKFDTTIYRNFNLYEKFGEIREFSCIINNNQKINFNKNGDYIIYREFKEVIVPDFKAAIKYKDVASIKYLLLITTPDEKATGFTFLLENYMIGDNFYPQAFKLFMNSDLNFMYVDNQGTFLHKIALTANKYGTDCSDEIAELSKKGIDANVLCNGSTALILYIKGNSRIHLGSIAALLKAGSQVSIKDSDGKDALYYAKNAPDEVRKILKEYKAKEK